MSDCFDQPSCMFTDGCPPVTTMIESGSDDVEPIAINWPETNIGINSSIDCPCGTNISLGSTQLKAYHFCGGDFLTGGTWSNLIDNVCNFSRITRKICELSNVSVCIKISVS